GPWEYSPYNPIVHTYNDSDPWWSKGHGTLIDDADGHWWIVYHAYAQGYHTLGRQTLIDPVEWTSDGWCRIQTDARPLPVQDPERHGMRLSDDFKADSLGLQWTSWKENATNLLSFGPKGMAVPGKGTSPADARLLLVTATDKSYELKAEITLDKGSTGGLILFYNEKAFAGLTSDGKNFTLYKDGEHHETFRSSLKRHFHVRLLNRANRLTVSVSPDGRTWNELAADIDVSGLHHNNYGGFYALRPALVSAGKGTTVFRSFDYRNAVPQEKDMAAYLMVYHQDEDHSLHAALSRDGYTFTALNHGKPIISGDTIAEQKGIRDPHIYRGQDGGFYLAMTDLHIYAQREGYRNTEWERDGKTFGWGNNRGLVLMKSFDLIHWTRTHIRLDKLSKEFEQIGCAWAPETVYDPQSGRMMIYFTMRFGNEQNSLYYMYVNNDFNRIESTPQILFEYPVQDVSAIDGDITPLWNPEKQKMEYRLFYVSHEGESGIKQAVSDRIDGGYVYDPRWYDFEPGACEAPTVWKRIGEQKWVLMYDIFSIQPHNFGFAETTDFVHFKNLGHLSEKDCPMKATNFASPKHGAVVQLTSEEADRLENYWNNKAR
ncbi:MAG: family 43 glycosylhydrolase, partial [Paraprevotella sp.]|nr:family 43 glycosylhydrolase [Paraprevotella sp.]